MTRSAVLSIFLLAVAAGDQAQQHTTTGHPPSPPRVSYFKGTAAADALRQIRAKVGEPFRVLSMNFFDTLMTVYVQNPKRQDSVDAYQIGAAGQIAGPLRFRSLGVTDHLWDPSDVDFDRIPDVVHEAGRRIVVKGSEPLLSVHIQRLGWEDHVSIDVEITTSRDSKSLHTDQHGKHAEVY